MKRIIEAAKIKVTEIKDGIAASNEELRELRKVRPDLFRKGGRR